MLLLLGLDHFVYFFPESGNNPQKNTMHHPNNYFRVGTRVDEILKKYLVMINLVQHMKIKSVFIWLKSDIVMFKNVQSAYLAYKNEVMLSNLVI